MNTLPGIISPTAWLRFLRRLFLLALLLLLVPVLGLLVSIPISILEKPGDLPAVESFRSLVIDEVRLVDVRSGRIVENQQVHIRDGLIVRPLIHLKKDQIIRFLNENRIDFVLDESNQDRKLLRNRIRHDVIPSIETSLQTQIVHALTRMAHITRSEEEWLDQIIEPLFEESILDRSSSRLVLSVDRLKTMHPAVQRRVLRKAISQIKGNLRRITFAHIESVKQNLRTEMSRRSIDLPDRIRVSSRGSKLFISKEDHPLRQTSVGSWIPRMDYHIPKLETVVIKEIGAHIQFSEMSATNGIDFQSAGHHSAFFDMDRVRFPLILRNFHIGDRFSPLGMTGTQKVKDFFINNKIPREDRGRYPLLVSNDRIIWVVGLRIDESVKVTPATRTVLKVKMTLPDGV